MPSLAMDYTECLKDSPKFRQQLNANETSLDDLENKLEKLLKVCDLMVDGGKAYITQQAQFVASLWELSSYFASEQESETNNDLNKVIHTFQELLKFQNSLVVHGCKEITATVSTFIKENMQQMKETRGYFNKLSRDLDDALHKNSAVSKSKSRPADMEDASNYLTATRSCFRWVHTSYPSFGTFQ